MAHPYPGGKKMALGLRGSFLGKQRMANQWLTPIPRDHTSMYNIYTCRYLLWVGL